MIPYNLSDPRLFGIMVGVMFLMVVSRLLLVAGFFSLVYVVASWTPLRKRRVNLRPYQRGQFWQEFGWSLVTAAIFALAGAIAAVMWQRGWTAVYLELNSPWDYMYFPVSIGLVLLLHETYYYWLHRWMHQPKIYRRVHRVHHHSIVASPWTAFSFHPWEACLQAIFLPLIIVLVPLHPYAIVIQLSLMTLSSVINHLNLEIYPRGFAEHWLGQWLIGATHHSLHHSQFRCNYGLYFTFWDRWLGTESRDYLPLFRDRTQG
ncbi:2,2'-beta-hydroxylase CrtG [Thermosynechococcus vestitus]|uniref:Sterol desaturase family protein n=1 Tax=Thermosynechococcus vestitus (strain NIES-2133 / IAM M-273 / BP-1) TaxID=197221 RepID=Q8DHM9_THEVB|nr:sterol desaturase family protein [Thermosynechococcus vestitus]BAC09469.1 sterol desaturase family protein [Thermosynechococcus vestitus BP-1]